VASRRSITPDPSAQAAITAFVNACSLQPGRKSLLRSMTSSGQSSDGMNFVQLIAGSPAPGVWVSPHASHQAEGQRILSDAGVSGSAMSFVASYGQVGSQDDLVTRSWDLGALEQRYEDFIEEFTGLDPAADGAALRAQTRLVHEWRRFPFLDPRLPAPLLPENWSAAARIVGMCSADRGCARWPWWRATAARCLASCAGRSAGRRPSTTRGSGSSV
jgi:hypothetical protein